MTFRIRFSLRTLLLAFLLASVTPGLWTRRSLEQQQRVRRLPGVGLNVKYDIDDASKRTWAFNALRWLAGHLGKDWVSVPVAVQPSSESVVIYPNDCETISHLRFIRAV